MNQSQWSAVTAVAKVEFRVLLRNRVVASSALFVPLMFAAALIRFGGSLGDPGGLGALQVAMIAGFGSYVTVTTTLSARRQTHFLKRLRSTVLDDPAILIGLIAPVLVVNLMQLGVVLAAVAEFASPPQGIATILVGVLLVQGVLVGLAIGTSGVTHSPEQAQITTVPVLTGLFGLASWSAMTSSDDWMWVKRALPGGAALELVSSGWRDVSVPTAAILVGISLIWVGVGAVLGRRLFHWEPRRD